ncbi:SDR family NAD(P)-dependent oxidoreductase [Rhodoferax sp.]|uniref:SDR family NAD(P)-dependent oxidoreductase n=1 Tax=Rhodoferax sp. TaxID=50421 RepID=UPI002778C993|nr:SDR family NAD(P)-dependent oxidoreductase [Rhodoferax sp.]
MHTASLGATGRNVQRFIWVLGRPSRMLCSSVRTWFAEAETDLRRNTYFNAASPLLEAMTVSFIRDAFIEAFACSGDQLQRALNQPDAVAPNLRPFLGWMVSVLRRERLLIEQTSGSFSLEADDLPPARHIWRTILRDYPANLPELVLAARIGRQLPALLRGDIDCADFVETLSTSHQYEALIDDSPAYLGTRLAVQHVLCDVATGWPAHRRLRVLEVVAGTSTSLQQLLGRVPGVELDYVIASGSEEVYARLCAEYATYPCAVVARFDGDGLNLTADGPIPEHFDIIILQHTLHRAAHPAGVLVAARRRLARSGLLIVAERHPDLAVDFVFGLDSDWWALDQNGKARSRLQVPKVWEQTLLDQGFVDVNPFSESVCEGLAAGAYLMLAKRPDSDVIAIAESTAATWLLLCDPSHASRLLADTLGSQLQSQGHRVLVAPVADATSVNQQPGFDPEDPASADALLVAGKTSLGTVDNLVYLAGQKEESSGSDDKTLIGVFHVVQAMARANRQPRLWLVTAGGALVEGLESRRSCHMQQAALWGLGRVVMNESPTLKCTLIDLNIAATERDTAFRLQSELLQPDGETEIVLDQHGRFALRMERVQPSSAAPTSDPDASRFRLDFRVPGQLRNLLWLAQPERTLAENEVEVRVVATGLNFRDIMYLMGLLPDEAVENGFAGASLGLEFSGIVTRVHNAGGEFSVGDAVMGFGSACFASHVVTQSIALTHKPSEWSYEAAATVPTVFFTVFYALKQLANVQPGERVLIHGAAGGVGIAAIQLAVHLGAEIFVTVGSAEKHDFVTLLGADHVFDSRSLAFADDILACTGGEGVDVILNSLAGEAIRRNLRVLKPFGRFLELGKRDFFENTPLGLRPFKDNISYFGIDADQLLLARPALAGRLFREVMALFRDGVLFPLPYRVFSAEHVVGAFRAMQQSRHIGKVVVRMDGARVAVERPPTAVSRTAFGKESCWLVTGGLAGFGLESARWLAQRGVGHLVLLGRRGALTPGAEEAAQSLRALGASVEMVACDITDHAAVKSVFTKIRREGPPLTGILHAAMVLDDALIANLDATRMRKVLAPKMQGAWHLHQLSLDLPLDHFVLYSSVTAAIGNPGQANYVAANASLECLAALRRSLGLPATCIAWGPIGDAGYLTRNLAVKGSLGSRLGADPLGAHQALAMLDHLLPGSAVTTTVADFDWATLSRLLPSAQAPRFDILRRQAGPAAQADTDGEDIQSLIAGKSPNEVHGIIRELVTRDVAQVLCVGADRVDPMRSLHDMGMDSLMGVELALGLEKRFGIRLPAMMLSEGPSVERVTLRIVHQVLGASDRGSSEGVDHMDAVVALMAAQHGEDVPATEMAEVVEHVRDHSRAQGQ